MATGQRNAEVRVSLQVRGAVLAGLGVAMLLAGLWRVDSAMATLGLALVVLVGCCGLLARWNGSRLDVSHQGPDRVQAAAPFPLRLRMTNRHRLLDAFGLRAEVEIAGRIRAAGALPWVPAGSTAELDLRLSLPERMIINQMRLHVWSDVPFGLFEVHGIREVATRLVVTPVPMTPRGLAFAPGPVDMHEEDPAKLIEGPGEPRGLRLWRPGDPPKRTQWPATLRSFACGGGPLVVDSDPPGFRPAKFAVVVHSFGTDGKLIRPDRFERALSLAAGTLRMLASQGMPAKLIADFDNWTSRPAFRGNRLAACLEVLAGARRAMGSEAHDLQAALAGIHPDEALVIISDMPASAWSHALPAANRRAFVPDLPVTRGDRKEVAV